MWAQSPTKYSYSHSQRIKHVCNSHIRLLRFYLVWALHVATIFEIGFTGEGLVFWEGLKQCKSRFSTQNSETKIEGNIYIY